MQDHTTPVPVIRACEHSILDAETAHAVGLERREYGLLHIVNDTDGLKWTVAGDPEYLRLFIATPDWARVGLEIPIEKFPLKRPGWPDEWNQLPAELARWVAY